MTRGVLLFVFTLCAAWSSSFAQRGGFDPAGQFPTAGPMQQDVRPHAGGMMDQIGAITGSVHSLSGKPLNDVQVQLRNLNGGGPVTTTYTDQSGAFYFNGIPAGSYELVAVSGVYQASDRVEVKGMTASASLRIPVRDTTPNDGAGNNTISVAQYRVPEKAREEFMKARAASAKSRTEEAQKHLQRALEIYPNYADALTLRAIFELSDRNAAAAVDDTQKAIQADSSYALAYTVMGAALNATGSFDEALRVLRRGETLAPDFWQTYYEQGKAYLGKSDYRASMQQLDKAASLMQDQFPIIHVVRARALMGLNQSADAVAELEAYLGKEPNGEESVQARAMLEKVRGK
jgi:tetratricopeptide (TPR) repeat protein